MSFKQINESFDRLFESFEKEGGPFWYYTKHGLGPGTIPKGVQVVDTYEDDDFNTWVALDKVLDTEELDYYELREEKPPIYESLNEEKIDGKHIIQVSIDAYVENDYDESDLINWIYDVLTRNGYYVYGVDIIESWTNDEYNRKTGLSLADDDKHIILLSFDIEVEDEYYERDIVGCVEQELGLDILGSDITATWTDEDKYYHNIQESLLTEKIDNDGFTPEEAEVYWDLNHEGDAILAEFDDFADWYEYLRENNWINEDEVIDDLIIYAEDILGEYMEMYEGESWHKIVYEAAKKAYECFSERGQDVGPLDKKRMIRIIADGLPSTKKGYLDRFLKLKKGQREKAIKSYELSKYKNDKLYQSESLQESEKGRL